MRAQEKSLYNCRQLTVTASPAFLSKNVTCSEPGTIRSCRMSSPADWWKWLTLGCQLENQLFTSTRQLPPTHQAAAGRGKGRLLRFVVNMHYPFLRPWSTALAESIGCCKLRNREVGRQLHLKHLETSWQLCHTWMTGEDSSFPHHCFSSCLFPISHSNKKEKPKFCVFLTSQSLVLKVGQ